MELMKKKAWQIASQGFASISTQDRGYYGKGIYFSSNAFYTVPYFITKKKPVILICFVIPGNPYPVTESSINPNNFTGKHIETGYQSHYVIVTKTGRPFTLRDYDNFTDIFDELVIEQESQAVPIMLLKIARSCLSKLSSQFRRNTPDGETYSILEGFGNEISDSLTEISENKKKNTKNKISKKIHLSTPVTPQEEHRDLSYILSYNSSDTENLLSLKSIGPPDRNSIYVDSLPDGSRELSPLLSFPTMENTPDTSRDLSHILNPDSFNTKINLLIN